MGFDFAQKYTLTEALAQIKPAKAEAAEAARARLMRLLAETMASMLAPRT